MYFLLTLSGISRAVPHKIRDRAQLHTLLLVRRPFEFAPLEISIGTASPFIFRGVATILDSWSKSSQAYD